MSTPPASTLLPDFTGIDESLASAFPPHAPGAAVIIVKDRQILLRKGYGMANLEWGIPNTPGTVFRIGSVTKQFTAVASLMLVEQGKLDLQDPIEKFLPGYPAHGHIITVEHLLTHTSGIKSYTGMKEWLPVWGKDFKLEELIDFFKFQPMDSAPGQRWIYNNSAYILLAAVIQQASGLAYDEFLEQKLLKPLGMLHTCLELPGRIIPNRAAGYEKGAQGFTNAAYISMTQPLSAGGMVSTIDDLACWDQALYEGQLLPPETLRRAHIPYKLQDGSSTNYGYGWGIHQYEGFEIQEHGGGIHGFACHALRVPAARVFAAVLTNSGNPVKSPSDLTFLAATRALGIPFPEPQVVEVPASGLVHLAGVYEIEAGSDLLITLADSRLGITWPGQPERELLAPVGESTFVVGNSPLNRLDFLKDPEGQITGLEFKNQYGETWLKAKRTEKALPEKKD
jgi:D-alanyl-D-alanine carboxypeptidase